MKIIISPSKNKEMQIKQNLEIASLLFENEHRYLKAKIENNDHQQLIEKLKIPKTKKYFTQKQGHAIFSYKGEQFKTLDVESLNLAELKHLTKHLLICSAFYGLVKPLNLIEDYYLDNHSKLLEKQSLANYWQSIIDNYLKDQDIINLASKEFSQKIKASLTVDFKDKLTNKNIGSVKAKHLRGQIAREIIKHKFKNVKQVINYLLKNYDANLENKIITIYI